MRQVELLKALPRSAAESWQIRSHRLKPGEGFAVKNICSVVVKTQLLLTRNIMIQARSDLVLADLCVGNGTVGLATEI